MRSKVNVYLDKIEQFLKNAAFSHGIHLIFRTVKLSCLAYHSDREVESDNNNNSDKKHHEGCHDKEGLLKQHQRVEVVIDLGESGLVVFCIMSVQIMQFVIFYCCTRIVNNVLLEHNSFKGGAKPTPQNTFCS